MRIITIGREFGSGGRELGKRLAEELQIPSYDKEIITAVANLRGISPDHVERISESDIRGIYPSTIGHTFTMPYYFPTDTVSVLVSQQDVIRRLAKHGDCVIVGRCADVLLQDMHPLNLFVYANEESKLARCLERAQEGETERYIRREMKRIDKERAANRRIVTNKPWGKKETYHLCIDTTNVEIKAIIPALAAYARAWFDSNL